MKGRTLHRILNECTALESLVVRFVEWDGAKKTRRQMGNNRRNSSNHSGDEGHADGPRQDLSSSMEFEHMLKALEEPFDASLMQRSIRSSAANESQNRPLSLDFHPENKLLLKTLEIRNQDASQFHPDLIKVIAQCCESVTTLTLFGFQNDHIHRLMERVPKANSLQTIHIGQVSSIRVDLLNLLAAHCLCLRELQFTNVTYQGFVPSYPNDFSKFYSLESLDTLECTRGGSLTEAVLSMLPRHDTDISQFKSISYHSLTPASAGGCAPPAGRRHPSTAENIPKLPFDHISLRELTVAVYDEPARAFTSRNISYLTRIHILDTITSESDLQFILNCKYLQDLKLRVDNSLSLSHLFGILSRQGSQFHLKKLSVHLGYTTPEQNSQPEDHLFDLNYQSMRQLHELEVFGQFQVLPLCFCPVLKHLTVNDMHFDDIHSLLMILGHYNQQLESLELFSSNVVPVMDKIPREKQPLGVCFSTHQVRIMVSACHPHVYDMVRLLIHFPQASFCRLQFPIVFSRELCMPFVKHRLLPTALDAFKALILWCIDQIASRELQLSADNKDYITSLIQLVDVFDPHQQVVELPLLSHLFDIFRKKFAFAPQLPPFSPPRSLTRVVVFEKHRQFVQHIKRKQRSLLQVLEEFTI
eukprot:CAMPEP_0117443890 /NCGR_PEP_ID=MMETSP0759-20121206/4943_1 /TAXON_ID=63605 /ORGANISM="Percolomonas cosmopolitus, Strain WS" /LENGTH=642 /DNA_ID=CAMNT_0005235909 /DNA_START=407 /DNA_END=2335 /DNA_ORIENTATION=+